MAVKQASDHECSNDGHAATLALTGHERQDDGPLGERLLEAQDGLARLLRPLLLVQHLSSRKHGTVREQAAGTCAEQCMKTPATSSADSAPKPTVQQQQHQHSVSVSEQAARRHRQTA